jgi:hypothetical protein
MEVGQGPNWGCSAKGGEKKENWHTYRRYTVAMFEIFNKHYFYKSLYTCLESVSSEIFS